MGARTLWWVVEIEDQDDTERTLCGPFTLREPAQAFADRVNARLPEDAGETHARVLPLMKHSLGELETMGWFD